MFTKYKVLKKTLCSKFYIPLGAVLAFSFLTSCSRDDGDSKEKSKISIALPSSLSSLSQKVGSLSGANPTLIYAAVSVTGSGMAPVEYQWESCKDSATASVAPSSFDFDLPGGQGRVFQLLAAYETPSTGEVIIYYGDKVADLTGGELNLPISIQRANQGPFVQGRVSGRYLDGVDTGPTDIVDVYFLPPNGRPKMKFETSSITAGWFNFFMLAGAEFQFTLRTTGEILWGQSVNLESAVFNPVDGGNVMRAYYPAHVRRQTITPPPYYEYYLESPKILTWGFWNKSGSAGNAVTKYVCHDIAISTMEKMRVYNATTPSSTAGLTISYSYAGLPTSTYLANTSTPATSVHILGGDPYDTGMSRCGGHDISSKFDKFLYANSSNVDGSGNDNYSGFKVPFQADQYGNIFTVSSASATPTRLFSTKLLPGVSTPVTHLKYFTKIGFTSNDYLEKPQCSKLESEGWTAHASAATPPVYTNSVTNSVSILQAGTAAVACPMKSATEFLGSGAMFVSTDSIPIPATMTTTWSAPSLNQGQCIQIIADLKDTKNNFLNVGSNTTFNFTVSGVSGSFYSDPSCISSQGVSGTGTMPNGNATVVGYFKATTSGATNFMINGTPFGIAVSGTLNLTVIP